jgi:hypothetical protein
MYIYIGWLDFGTYAVDEPFALVVETDFTTGAAVRALWTWTKDSGGNEHVQTQCSGTVDLATTNTFNDTYSFGLFYNRYYPFDITFQGDFSEGQATMYEYPKDDSKCYVVATFTLILAWTGREKAIDYYPARVLPSIQYFQGTYNNHLFAMILPDNLCDNGLVITLFSEDSGDTIWCPQSLMALTSQTTTKAIVEFTAGDYDTVMELDKDDDNWKCDSWSDNSSSDDDEDLAVASLKVKVKKQKKLGQKQKKLGQKQEKIGQKQTKQSLNREFITRTKPKSHGKQISSSPSPPGKKLLPMPSKQPNRFSLAVSSNYANNMSAWPLDRVTTIIKNNADDPVFCTLRETTTGVQGKILAGAGAALALIGIIITNPELAAASIPVAIIGALLASTGLYDAFKPDQGPVKMLLFPKEIMSRTTSAGLPFDDANDLEMIREKIDGNFLRRYEGKKGSLGDSTYNLSTFILDASLWTQEQPYAFDSNKTITIKWAKLVKFDSLVPMYPSATMTTMGSADYYVVGDGQLVLTNNGSAATYNTLNDIAGASTGKDLFQFDSNQKSILRHDFLTDASSRNHDIIRVPGSKLVVLRIKYCSIVGVQETDKNSIRRAPTNPTSESDVFAKMASDSGYDLYSWTSSWPVFGYKMDKLGSATIQKTTDASNVVYIPATGWRPWREVNVS